MFVYTQRVLIRADAYTLTGTYAFTIPQLPYTPGVDGAGIVEAIGEEVTNVRVGDRVFIATLNGSYSTGTFAQKVVCDKTIRSSITRPCIF